MQYGQRTSLAGRVGTSSEPHSMYTPFEPSMHVTLAEPTLQDSMHG